MTAETREAAQGYVLQPQEGRRVENLGLRILATGQETKEAFTAAVVTNPGPGGPPLHTHAGVDELYYVVRGTYRFRIGDKLSEGGGGTFVYVPRGASHSFASIGTGEGQLFTITLPATDGFLQAISELEARGVDQREMYELFRQFDSEITGSPLI